MTWHVYLVECSDGTLYCGVTKDITRRLEAHNAGQGARYTRGRLPVRLVWSEPAGEHGAALRREYAVKALTRRQKDELVTENRKRMRSPHQTCPG